MAKVPGVTEEQFQQQVFDLAHIYGWQVAHFRPARTAYGWRTAVSADGKGFPDTVMVKAGQPVIFAELKRKGGKPTLEQVQWMELLRAVPGVLVRLWQPDDFDEIQKVLSKEESNHVGA